MRSHQRPRVWRMANRIPWAVAKFLLLSFAEQCAMVHQVALLAVVEVLVRTWPLPRAAGLLGVAFADAPTAAPQPGTLALSARDARKVRTARRITRHWPFCVGTCLRESLLVGHVLQRHDPQLVVGVTRTNGIFTAHAWIEVHGRTIGDSTTFRPLGVHLG